MSILSWAIGLSAMATILFASQSFHEVTVCRQEAWRGSLILATRPLLADSREKDQVFSPKCALIVTRQKETVQWTRSGTTKASFEISLKGKL